MRRAERGSAVVEFVLVLPVVLLLVVALVEVAVIARDQLHLWSAAREGARVAATTPDVAAAVSATNQALGSLAGATRITVSRPAVVGRTATVEVATIHRLGVPLFGDLTFELTAAAGMRVER